MEPVTRSGLSFQIKWPEDLNELKLGKRDKKKLQGVIESLYRNLSPKNSTNNPYAYHERDNTCPRKVFATHKYCFVVLNSHNGMPYFDKQGLQQDKIKFVWECREGCFWLKKRLFTAKQFECLYLLNVHDDVGLSSLGFPKIELDMTKEAKGKYRYFEKKAELSLPEWLKEHGPNFDIKSIIGFIDAIRKIHEVKYRPPSFTLYPSRSIIYRGLSHTLFHGDVSPNNFICEKTVGDEPDSFKIMFTDFHSLGDLNHIYWTSGWASPEVVQRSITRTKYQELDTSTFLKKYGAKKDTWALGLIIGSLLRRGFHPKYEQSLPCFSFITDKLTFDSTGQKIVDESGIAKITQEEIDTKIDSLMEETQIEAIRQIWTCVKEYLRVDPDQRPTVYEHHLIIGS